MKANEAAKLTRGQEVICPYGLGRVFHVEESICGTTKVTVDTYIANRQSTYDSSNISLPEPSPIQKEILGLLQTVLGREQ